MEKFGGQSKDETVKTVDEEGGGDGGNIAYRILLYSMCSAKGSFVTMSILLGTLLLLYSQASSLEGQGQMASVFRNALMQQETDSRGLLTNEILVFHG